MDGWKSLSIGVLMLAGCGSAPMATVQGNEAPLGNFQGLGLGVRDDGDVPANLDMRPYQDGAGAVGDLRAIPSGFAYARLTPGDTQAKADDIARAWAADARQVYVGWGYLGTSLLGQNQHCFYSASRKRKLMVSYRLLPWKPIVEELPVHNFDLANKVLQTVPGDIYPTHAQLAHDTAQGYGYHPAGKAQVGALINPLILGPTWVFLDDEVHRVPQVGVRTRSGMPYKGGIEMLAMRYLFAQDAR